MPLDHIHDFAIVDAPEGSTTDRIVRCKYEGCEYTFPFATRCMTERELEEEFNIAAKEELLEFNDVKDFDHRMVWTIVENGDNNNWYALPGFHIVNKLGYVVGSKPWTDDIAEAMYFEDDFDHDEEDD